MCGIAGIIYKTNRSLQSGLIESMVASIAHRGPDGSGCYKEDHVELGHARLAIIDLDGGRQPMANKAGSLCITYNGEIYNYKELAKELSALGHRFQTTSDTEVVLAAYKQWGWNAFDKFRGMFALAIFDKLKGTVTLARDHFGIKPLVIYEDDDVILFASELTAIKQYKQMDRTIALEHIDTYLACQYIPAPGTAYKHVTKLEPATYTSFDLNGRRLVTQRYWRLGLLGASRHNADLSLQDSIDLLQGAFAKAVRSHTISDVGVGAFLSGGLDSSMVVSELARVHGRKFATFSVGFESNKHDERMYSRHVAQQVGSQHHEIVVSEDGLSLLPELVRHHGEPFADSSAIPTYFLSKLAAKHVKVALSGDGGDEMFAGYQTYTDAMRLQLGPRTAWRRSKFQIGNFLRRCGLKQPLPSSKDAWARRVGYFNHEERLELWGNVRPREWLTEQFESLPRELDLCSKLQLLDIESYLPNDILTKVDTASMSHGLEVRVPLLDRDFATVAASIPWRFKWKEGSVFAPDTGKYVWKQLGLNYFDRSFVYRRKQGFEVPIVKWLNAARSAEIRDQLTGSSAPILNLLNVDAIAGLLDRQFTTGGEHHKVWALMVLNEWLRQETTSRR